MTGLQRRHAVPDRARRRAIRALAAQLNVAYSVAARLLAAQSDDPHRAWLFAQREQRTFHARVRDTREAADLPLGRAAHLTARYPRLRDLYGGPHRRTVLALLYAVIAHESPTLLPARAELEWVAELGEETAVDITCGAVDRAARSLLDDEAWRLWHRAEEALAAAESGPDRAARDVAITLTREFRATSLRQSLPGARQTLDALLAEPYDQHAPGAHLDVDGRPATVIGARWPQSGPAVAYEVIRPGSPTPEVAPIEPSDSLTV